MRIYPAIHYTMGGLWVDYNLMSNIPGLYVLGEANFSDHGANRLGRHARSCRASPTATSCCRRRSPTTSHRCSASSSSMPTDPAFREAEQQRQRVDAEAHVDQRHPLGRPLPPRARQHRVGVLRHGAQPRRASRRRWPRSPRCARSSTPTCGCSAATSRSTRRSRRPDASTDFFEFAELMCTDALHREESCGGHFRVEHQTEDGEASATTRTSPTSPRGSSPASATRPSCTRSRSSSSTSTSPSAATHDRLHRFGATGSATAGTGDAKTRMRDGPEAPGVAPGRAHRTRPLRGLRRRRRQPRHVVPRAVRRPERAAPRRRARSRWRSTTTAARASAARAR